MFSMPPATATLMLPSAISCAAETMACAPEPQTRLTVSAGTVTGRLAWTAACRAGFILVPACTTLPMTTVSTSSGFSPARLTAAPIATAPRAGAGTSLRLPPKVPIAVRTGSAKTTECDGMVKLLSVDNLLVHPVRLSDRRSHPEIMFASQRQQRPQAQRAEPSAACYRRGVDDAENCERNCECNKHVGWIAGQV